MEKDITYYQQLAEKFYLSHFAEIKEEKDKENAESFASMKEMQLMTDNDEHEYNERYWKQVLVCTKNESCIFPNWHAAATPRDLIFSCSMEEGKVKTALYDDGKDKITEALGLTDIYDDIERIEVDFVRKEDRALHLDLPEKLQHYSKDFFKIKLLNLDEFASECNYTGWGDCDTCNVLEVLAGVMKQDFVDFKKNEIFNSLNWYVGPGDSEDMNYYAEFEFSHCEIAYDDFGRLDTAYICYKYRGLEEYE